MRITPVDEEAYRKRGPWRGWFPCRLATCAEGVSQAGNGYFRCDVEVTNKDGEQRRIVSYIMATGRAAWQLRAAAEAFGQLERYRSDTIEAADLVNATAHALLGVEAETGRNVIREFAAEIPSVAMRARRQELRQLLKGLED